MKSLNELRDEAYGTAKEHGWHEGEQDTVDHRLSEIALMHSELGECTEAIRKNNWTMLKPVIKELGGISKVGDKEFMYVKDTVEDELADVLIRVLDFCGAEGIDIESHVAKKMEYNKARPYRHGGKLA